MKLLQFLRYNSHLLLRFCGRFLYSLSNMIYKTPKVTLENKRTFEVQQLLANTYEPKRKFRWVLKIDGIPPFVVKSVNRPSLSNVFHPEDHKMSVSLYDPVEPSMSHEVYKWFQNRDMKKVLLTLLDPVGQEVEKWTFSNASLDSVDFGSLDYSSPDPVEILINLSYTEVTLD